MNRLPASVSLSAIALTIALLSSPATAKDKKPAAETATKTVALTAADADAFVAAAEKQLAEYSIDASRIQWVNATYITDDTDALAAKSGAEGTELAVKLALEAARFQKVADLSPDTIRKLDLLRGTITLPAPTKPGAADELATIVTRMSSQYGKGKGTLEGKPINGSDIEAAMGTMRDPAKTKEMWVSWHDNVGAQMHDDYARSVVIANQGATELGYQDVGAMWRSGYDMSPKEFAALTDKLWREVEPLYRALHAYTRAKLNAKYGDAVQSKTGPIRADLLGNMWAQEWGNIYDIVAPKGAGDLGFDTGDLLKEKGYDPLKMVKAGEGFYSSLGFAPLPDTF